MKKIEIKWDSRYSETMEDDDLGRWARVAWAGRFGNMGFFRGKVCRWEIAWIKKLQTKEGLKFVISYDFPSHDANSYP